MTGPLVFVDTETTGLTSFAFPWEIAVIRRKPDGSETTFVAHIANAVDLDPHASDDALDIGGYHQRIGRPPFDPRTPDHHFLFDHAANVMAVLAPLLSGQLIGVGVHYDARVLMNALTTGGWFAEPWHYGLLDLKAATWGVLAMRAAVGVAEQHEVDAAALPMRSEQLAAALGVQAPTAAERHTALGDARWAARWFDTLTGAVR